MAKRTGLGRGIGALIPSPEDATAHRPVDVFFPASGASAGTAGAATAGAAAVSSAADAVESRNGATELVSVPGAHLASISPNDVVPNANQPRKEFREEELNELIVSIREIGVLQPIVVRPIKDAADGAPKYELVMGERRLRASKAVGLDRIPAVVKETADDAMLRDALLENLHRAELNPLEEASAYQQLLADFSITQEELAGRIGRSRPQITNTIRLLKLPASVQSRVAAGVLSAGHARAILSLVDVELMEKLANKIVNEDLSVRAAEAAAAQLSATPKRKPAAGRRQGQLDEIADRLGDRLNTRVKVNLGVRKGTVTIDFASVGDLNRILGELGEPGFG
jgi:ParB family chromosome partitioning protein